MYVYKGLQGFIAELLAPLSPTAAAPTLRSDKEALLYAVLSNGGHTYLVISSPVSYEIVKVEGSYNTLVMTRGQDGTAAQPHPKGACIAFEMVGAAVTDLAMAADACPQGCTEATILSGGTPPAGTVGQNYEHRLVLSGTPPFKLGQVMAPSWMDVTLDAGEVRLSGIPDAPGTYNVIVPMYSCGVLSTLFNGCVQVAPAGGP
jgi:hypothetical protein